MSLQKAIQGATRTGMKVTFLLERTGCPYMLDSVEMSATIKDMETGIVRSSTGIFTILNANEGQFSWKYSAVDVAIPGSYFVQFKATSTITGEHDLSFPEPWEVLKVN